MNWYLFSGERKKYIINPEFYALGKYLWDIEGYKERHFQILRKFVAMDILYKKNLKFL